MPLIDSVTEFHRDFAAGKYPHQRKGQAFCNAFGLTNPSLFYETNEKKVNQMIKDWSNPAWYNGEPDESMDGDHASALASAGFGTDEDYFVSSVDNE